MTYAASLASISRTPIELVVITLDYCSNSWGTAPCTATGTDAKRCFNTYPTCRDTTNFTKTTKQYKFTSAAVPIGKVGFTGTRPYIDSIDYLPTDITDNLTVSGSATITMLDEPDGDIGIDPYYAYRTNRNQGTFWKKLLARNVNWVGRPIEIYYGFEDLAEADYTLKMSGIIDTITFDVEGNVVIEAKDLLSRLEDTNIPPATDVELNADLTDSATTIALSNTTHGLTSGDYIRIDDEIILCATISGSTVSGATRGAFSTTAAAHSEGANIQEVRYYSPQSSYDILQSILTEAGVDAALINTTAFNAAEAIDLWSVLFSAVISEPTNARDLYFELVDLIDCRSWVTEAGLVTISKNLPNLPGRAYTELSDANNIIVGSDEADMNNNIDLEPVYTRVTMYWDKSPVGEDEVYSDYGRKSQKVDTVGESANMYNTQKEKVIYCRWLQPSYMDENLITRYVKNLLARKLRLLKNPMPYYTFEVELKDSGIAAGDYIRVSTDKIVDIYGAPLSKEVFQVVKREVSSINRIKLKCLKYPRKRIAFIAANAVPVYTSATDAQKESWFLCNSSHSEMSDGTEGYYLY